MRLIIEARLEGGPNGKAETMIVASVPRSDRNIADLRLIRAEGRALLAKVQLVLVSQQTASWMQGQSACRSSGSGLAHKDSRSIMMRNFFGKVELESPRLWECSCAATQLECLQAKWAAHLPYRQATELLQEALPLDKAISLSSTRRKTLADGKAFDAQIERDIACAPKPVDRDQVPDSSTVGCVSVDSGPHL